MLGNYKSFHIKQSNVFIGARKSQANSPILFALLLFLVYDPNRYFLQVLRPKNDKDDVFFHFILRHKLCTLSSRFTGGFFSHVKWSGDNAFCSLLLQFLIYISFPNDYFYPFLQIESCVQNNLLNILYRHRPIKVIKQNLYCAWFSAFKFFYFHFFALFYFNFIYKSLYF